MTAGESRVEIGYLEKTEPFKLESRFFPSKVGGKPAWLNLKNISVDLTCEICKDPCIFLCQVYAPIEEQGNAYHRTIFVFVCKNPECCNPNKSGNFKVFRCQLPKENDFYVAEEPKDSPEWHPESHIHKFNSVCTLCGCLGSFQCSKCKATKYCSKQHQVLDWKSGHNLTCGSDDGKSTNILFPEYEILTEPEEDSEEETEMKEERSEMERFEEYKELLAKGKAGVLSHLPDSAFEQFVENKDEKYLKKFKARINLCPDQVLRYDRGGHPLWIAEPDLPEEAIPACDNCQSPRQFEFQILPTLLSHLNVDSLDKSIDWGTLLIYTCKISCGDGPAYKREFIWKQDVL